MKRSFRLSRIVFHPSTLAIISGLFGAFIGLLINLISGGKSSQLIWIALVFAIMFSLSLTAWQVYAQEKTDKQWMGMLQEMIFHTYFLTALADKPEVAQIAQQRLGQVLKTLNGEQQVSMLKFFSHNGLSATFLGDALQGSTTLVGADFQKIELPKIHVERADLSRVNFSEANLSEANLSGTTLYRTNLSAANLSQACLTGTDMRGVNLRGANLTGADLSGSSMAVEKTGPDAAVAQGGTALQAELRANLSNAILSHTILRASNLIGADLSGADLRGADLTKAILSGVNLQGANLTEADLTEATFTGANLQGADLTGATLTWATFDEADVQTATVTEAQLQTLGSDKRMKREP